MGSEVAASTASRQGASRAHSSSAERRAAPGRVDWAPISNISAPAACIDTAWAAAAAGVAYCPPSEKLSGVTFRMPITQGVSSEMVPPRICQIMICNLI